MIYDLSGTFDTTGSAKKKDAKAKPKPKRKPPPQPAPSASAYRPVVSEAQESDFMAAVLGNMDTIAAVPPVKTRKRKPEYESSGKAPTRASAYGYRNGQYDDADTSSDGLLDIGIPSGMSSEDDFASTLVSPKKKLRMDTTSMRPAMEKLSKFHVDSSADEADNKMFSDADAESAFEGVDMDAFMDVDEDFDDPPVAKVKKEEVEARLRVPKLGGAKAKAEEKKPNIDAAPAWLSVYDSLTVKSEDTLGSQAGSSSRGAGSSKVSVLEPDGSLRFFWLDYLEHDGRLYFIGKTQDKTSKGWVSCCVTVENLQRNLFVLPRERRMEQDEETGELVETDIVPSTADVYADFDRVRKKVGVKAFKAKFVKRNYAFGETDVPRGEAQWLKVVYPFDGESRSSAAERGSV